MKDSKKKSENKFIKRISLFLAGVLATLGITHTANKLLPEKKYDEQKAPEQITDTLKEEEGNQFRDELRYEVTTPVKTEIQKEIEGLTENLGKATSKDELEELMLQDIKERYIKEYNETYGTDIKAYDIKLIYKAQSFAYVKDGKFYGKEKVDGAEVLQDQFAYRIYNNSEKQLEAVLEGNSSEDINILGKYQKSLNAIRDIIHNPIDVSIKLYTEGIEEAYNEQQINKNNEQSRE